MIYISGKITGKQDYKKDFERGAIIAAQLEKGEVINPALYEIENGSWRDYMILDLRKLIECDAIYMLHGWRKSKGARLEHKIAKALNMDIYYEVKI